MCGLSGHLAIWSPCVAGSEFGIGRRPAALIPREPKARISGSLSVKFLGVELFGWVVSQYLGVGLSVPRCGGSGCAHIKMS